LQHNDERPPTSGRPSLLSTEQQAATGGPRILGGHDSEAAPGAAGSSRSKRGYAWLAAGVIAVVAIGAGSAGYLDGDGEKEIVLASTEALPGAPPPGAPLAAELAVGVAPAQPTSNPEADQVSTAAILQDTPPVESKLAHAPQPAADELTKLLEHPGTAPEVPPRVIERAPAPPKPAVANPAPKPVVKTTAAKPAPAKNASTAKPAPKIVARAAQKKPVHPLAAAPSKKKGEVHPKASAGMDSDVTLLAALVAHSKALQPKKGLTRAEKLRQCKTLGSAAEAQQCRARVCAGGANTEVECKVPRIAKATTQS